MGNIKNIYFDWNKAGSCQVRQYDHLSNRVIFGNAPKFENFYLLVTMKESESDEQAKEMSPIKLTSPVWLIPNSYTQMVQQIKFQICNQDEDGTFEQHSAEYAINVVKSLEHRGEDIDVDPSPMYDAYKEYVDEKVQTMIAAAGDVTIDTTLSVSGAAADARAVGDAIKAWKTFVVQVPGSAAVYSGSITPGDFAKALAAYTAESGVYAVKDGEVYQLSSASSSTMTFTQMYHGTMNFIKQIQITSADTFTVTNTSLSSSAADTSYSNTSSGLTATNVQDAIDENAGNVSNVNERLDDSPSIKDTDADSGIFDLADEDGNVVARFENGHIRTKNFDSSETESDLAFETYLSDVQTAVDGTANTFIIQHDFNKGEKIVFHMIDGYSHMDYGRYAYYYEGNKVIASNRRGSNGYFEHIISADCASVKVIVNAGQYTAGTSLRLAVYIMRKEVVPKVVTVASDGTGMFATIKEAVESITDANHVTNPYVIEVAPGTYDTLEGYSDEVIATSTGDSTGFQGVILTDGISIKGTGMTREDVVLTATLDTTQWNSTVRSGISTLNIQGTGSIENLTIDANNIRYCVHDDFTTPRNEPVFRTVKNVKFTGNQIAYYPQFTSYGAGAGSPRNFVFKDCDFGYDLGIHTQGGYAYGCTILVENCTGHRFRIGDKATADTDAVNDFVVNNCNFDIIAITHTTALTKPHIRLSGTGNENVIVKCLATDIYQLGMIDKTENGLTVGQMVKRTSGSTSFEATNNKDIAYGIVIFSDSKYSYIIRSGYIASNVIGLSGLAVGDYITVDNGGLVTTGGTADNNIGIVTWLDADSNAYIKLRRW